MAYLTFFSPAEEAPQMVRVLSAFLGNSDAGVSSVKVDKHTPERIVARVSDASAAKDAISEQSARAIGVHLG